MADNKENMIEFSDDEVSSEDGEQDKEHGRKRNLQPLENATSIVWKFFRFLVGQDGKIMEPDK